MTQPGFIAAMAGGLTFGSYDCPVTVGSCQSEWIIVSSWSQGGDFLSVSRTNTPARRLGPAPRGLQPNLTHLGILLSHTVTPDQEETEYLLLRHQPQDVSVGGIFYPSDGYVRIVRKSGSLSLIARGRFAHCHGSAEGRSIVRDIPDPPPGYDKARAWHLTAVQRPWIGEFIPEADVTTIKPLTRPR